MGAPISYKLKTSLQGALAAGGDPATSPLYVFGPFLVLITSAGVATVTFGASIWMAVITVLAVAMMYRYVMMWVTDGSGGSGLCEEEFGSWAVKVNAAITVVEYTLTFLVSIAALVTFAADRVPIISSQVGFVSVRSFIAVLLSFLIAFIVNRGSKVSSLFFGPATALILGFLWVLIGFTLFKRGLSFPAFNFEAFTSANIHYTLGGFARILALMTGIEIFANLVASYEGSAKERSRKAFGSLIIVMGTTVSTMVIVGPAILELSNPADVTKSVFTQTMDALLPTWLSYAGTLIGIAVLLSAAAASTQGLQNLFLGLRGRHYIPAKWGTRNKFDVPAVPVWIQVVLVSVCFLTIGTHEETYLALYAAGVFILLSMTGWASTKRFLRLVVTTKYFSNFGGLLTSILSAVLASFATVIIFEERFFEGAWLYLLLVPSLYLLFDFYRKRLGTPPGAQDNRLEALLSASPLQVYGSIDDPKYYPKKILVPYNASTSSDVALRSAIDIGRNFGSSVTALFMDRSDGTDSRNITDVKACVDQVTHKSDSVEFLHIQSENVVSEMVSFCETRGFDLICFSSSTLKEKQSFFSDSLEYSVLYSTTPPVLIYRPTNRPLSRKSRFKNILIPVDGSEVSEQVLPYAASMAVQFDAQVHLLCVPEVQGDENLNQNLKKYLHQIGKGHFGSSISYEVHVLGSGPLRTILEFSESNHIDLIAISSHGRGGLERQNFVKIGSVSEGVLLGSDIPTLFISSRKS